MKGRKFVKYFLIEILVFALVLLGDQLSKHFVTKFLAGQPGRNYVLIENVLELQYSENTGASFGLFKNNTTLLTVITSIALAALLVYLIVAKKESKTIRIPLVLVFTGGFGNLIDRFAFQYVRDFIYFVPTDFAIFNIADSAITVGAVLLIVFLVISLVKEGKKPPEAVPVPISDDLKNDKKKWQEAVAKAYRLDWTEAEPANDANGKKAGGEVAFSVKAEDAPDGGDVLGADVATSVGGAVDEGRGIDGDASLNRTFADGAKGVVENSNSDAGKNANESTDADESTNNDAD